MSRYVLQNGQLYAEFDSFGAELCRLASPDGIEYLCPDGLRNWDGRAPVLFPNTGWIRDGYSLVGDEPYPYRQHGFARENEFQVLEHRAEQIEFLLRWSESTLRQYPFHFRLRIRYRLAENTLLAESTVQNEGPGPLYYSIGFHPGISCPLVPGERPGDHHIVFPTPMTASRLLLREAMTAEKRPRYWDGIDRLPIEEGMFDGGSFTMTDLTCRTVRLASKVSGRFLEVSLGDYPNLVLWAPRGRPITNICIEPWYGIPDSVDSDHRVEHKPFTICLAPGAERRLAFSICVGTAAETCNPGASDDAPNNKMKEN